MNLLEHNRSSRDGILSVQFMKASQTKNFGFNQVMKRFMDDLNDLIENGFELPNGAIAQVRFVQYRCDNLEKHEIFRIQKNFSTSKFPSSYSYITTDDRKEARTLSDILPTKFEARTKESYKVGVLQY